MIEGENVMVTEGYGMELDDMVSGQGYPQALTQGMDLCRPRTEGRSRRDGEMETPGWLAIKKIESAN